MRDIQQQSVECVERAPHDAEVARAAAEAAAARTARLQRVTAALAEAMTPEQVGAVMIEHGVGALGAAGGVLLLVDEEARVLRLLCALGYPEDVERALAALPLDAPLPLAAVARDGAPLYVESAGEWEARFGRPGPLRQLAGSRSWAAIPLVSAGRTLGVLGLGFVGEGPLLAEDRALTLTVAQQCAQALERARVAAALRASEARLAAIFAQAPVGLSELGLDGRFLQANAELARLLDRPAEEIARLGMPDVTHPDDVAPSLDVVGRALSTGQAVGLEKRYVRPDGTVVWAQSRVAPLRDSGGGPGSLLAVTVDLTARRQVEAALRESEARFRAVADLVPDLLWRSEADGRTTWYNARWYAYTGQRATPGAEAEWMETVHPDDRARSRRHLAEALRAGTPFAQEHRIRAAHGAYRWFLVRVEPVRDAAGAIAYWLGAATDVHHQRLALAEVERLVAERTAERDALRRALAEVEEAERRRLARELHDQLGQELTAFRLGLDEALRLAGARHRERVAAHAPLLRRLRQLQALAARMTAGARAIALELRPPELDDVGLESALRTYVAEWSARYEIPADLVARGLGGRPLPSDVGTALYRIVQEALTNVAKHAGASHVSVLVDRTAPAAPGGDGAAGEPATDERRRPAELRLIVEDDGRGFDVAAVAARSQDARRLGLAGMRERAALVGGTVTIESSAGTGATLYVRLPLGAAPDG